MLLKASAGGGGKGMRTVYDASKYVFSFFIHYSEDLCSPTFLSLKSEIEAAKGESLRAFGSDQLLIEKYFTSVRHVEVCRVLSFHMVSWGPNWKWVYWVSFPIIQVQIFGDQYGNIYHINERDCSIQRRHQKIVEVRLFRNGRDAREKVLIVRMK